MAVIERHDTPAASAVRAAQYVRMSTDHQKYSTENQAEVIAQYAARRGFQIVKTYEDSGKSGLSLSGRQSLQQIISDVKSGAADFTVILVYDVSRWGRFQDTDESAHYEYICRSAGISIHYCAEQFENDGTLSATIIKSMKRAMAGEYSRELSTKVFTGQCKLIQLGFRQGGPAGFGLRRQLIDANHGAKAILSRGEQKSLQTDRVILKPGPIDEIEVVRRLYRMFVVQRLSERDIANSLNVEGIVTDLGRAWTRGTVHQVLTNEKYVGHNVFNRKSFKLKNKRIVNPAELWVRRDNAFEAIVDADYFEAAQKIIHDRSRKFTDEELLKTLSFLLSQKGWLSGIVIDECDDMPSSSTYRHRFGSLLRAYGLIGYTPSKDYRYIETNRALRIHHSAIIENLIEEITKGGGQVNCDPLTDLLTVNNEFTVSLVIARCQQTAAGNSRWKIRFDTGLKPSITIVARMSLDNVTPQDYYLLPWLNVGTEPSLRLAPDNGILLDAYRFDTLETFFHLASRRLVRSAA